MRYNLRDSILSRKFSRTKAGEGENSDEHVIATDSIPKCSRPEQLKMPRVLTEVDRRAIGQHFVVGFLGNGLEAPDEIKILIQTYYIGNIIIMKRNIASLEQLRHLIASLQSVAKESGHEQPLLIGIDQENGLVSAFSSTTNKQAGTQFPGAMALAATGSTELAKQVSKATAEEMRDIGINWAYSPVADVNSDPRNPVIGVRSYGDDPYEVSKYTQAVSDGLSSGGIAPCAKHFPGHGDTHVDSHLSLPIINKSRQELDTTELVPFKALASGGNPIASVMTAHISLPKVFGDDIPASLSHHTIEILRKDFNYQGLIVTDCLEMEAIVQYCGTADGAVRSLISGADIAMICHRFDRQEAALTAAYAAFENGGLTSVYLEDSGKRIAALKAQFTGSWSTVLGHTISNQDFSALLKRNAEISQDAYAASTALVGDPLCFLPLTKGTGTAPVLLFTPEPESVNLAVDEPKEEGILLTADNKIRNTAGPSYYAFAGSISQRSATEHVVYTSSHNVDEAAILNSSSLIIATRNADRSPWQIQYLRTMITVASRYKKPVVVVATCTPYDLRGAEDILKTVAYICTFEFTVPALEAATAVIFGERKAHGNVPVDISSKELF